jgi:hypothetical protein
VLFARRLLGQPRAGPERRAERPHARQREQPAQPEGLQHRQPQAAGEVGDVRERVRAPVAVAVRVRKLPDPHTVEHDEEDAHGQGVRDAAANSRRRR